MITREFTGSIVGKDGATIYERVSGTIYVDTSGTLYSWEGVLDVQSGETPWLFEGFVQTDDGGRGECFGTRCSPPDTVIQFTGSGPAPFDIP